MGKQLFCHLIWNRKLTSRRFSARVKLESGYGSAAECAFVTEKLLRSEVFMRVTMWLEYKLKRNA